MSFDINKYNQSSLTNPISFFDHFYQCKGFSSFHKEFSLLINEYNSSYDSATETITTICTNENGYYEEIITFKKYLRRKLIIEFNKSKAFISTKILECKNAIEKEVLINNFIEVLNYLIAEIDNYSEANKYDDNKRVLLGLLKYLNKRYNSKNPNKGIYNTKSVEIKELKEAFINKDWEKYLLPFQSTTPPILSTSWEFIGSKNKHKGVLCSWIKELQQKGVINSHINRSTLSRLLNQEIKNLNLGKDGKTFDNVSKEYVHNFKNQLPTITKLP